MVSMPSLSENRTSGNMFHSPQGVKEEPISPGDGENDLDLDYDDSTPGKSSALTRRRSAHSVAEQKRRDAIKKGYDDLQTIVPACPDENTPGATKMSKAVILQKSVDYLKSILEEKQDEEARLRVLKDEVRALQILKANYQQMAKSTDTKMPGPRPGNAVVDEVKFNVIKRIMDTQFRSFNESIDIATFESLSASVIKWLEEECKPQKLQDVVVNSMRNANFPPV